MISCTEFIPAYSELFKYIEEIDGEEGVLKYWEHISDEGLNQLRDLVKSTEYEAASFTGPTL